MRARRGGRERSGPLSRPPGSSKERTSLRAASSALQGRKRKTQQEPGRRELCSVRGWRTLPEQTGRWAVTVAPRPPAFLQMPAFCPNYVMTWGMPA